MDGLTLACRTKINIIDPHFFDFDLSGRDRRLTNLFKERACLA